MHHKNIQIQACPIISTDYVNETPNYNDLSTAIHIYGDNPAANASCVFSAEDIYNREFIYVNLSHFKITTVCCSQNHILLLADIGQVFSFGRGDSGQLGHGTSINYLSEPTLIPGFDKFICGISCGKYHSIAIDRDGLTYTWGSEDATGHIANEWAPKQLDITTTSGEYIRVSHVASNDTQNIAISMDTHTMFIWGETFIGKKVPKPSLFYFDNNISFVQVALGFKFGIARTSTGEVYLWGDGTYGELAMKTSNTYVELPERADIPFFNNIIDVAAGDRHALVLDDCGNIYSFGDNLSGQCGDPTNYHTIIFYPRKVMIKQTHFRPVRVFCGSRHSACINESNQLFTWGHSSNQKLIFTKPLTQRPGVSVQSGQKSSCRSARIIYSLLHLKVTTAALGPEYTIVITGDGTHALKDSINIDIGKISSANLSDASFYSANEKG